VSNVALQRAKSSELNPPVQHPVFPGGFLPSVSFVTESIRKGGRKHLVIDSVVNIGVS
jgi:hypothetical protein